MLSNNNDKAVNNDFVFLLDDSTGLYSVYAEHQSNELMFHVSTLLPYTPNNTQQLPRKRYIGNDIVTVVFQEPEAKPFIPNLKSQFQHVFIVVRGMLGFFSSHYSCHSLKM